MTDHITASDIKWLDDPAVIGVNRVDAHSDHLMYADEDEYLNGNSSLICSLAGKWKFIYSECASKRPVDFYKWDIKDSSAAARFDEITVPGHIEMAGYDKLNYVNVMYPWDGHYFRRPLDKEGRAHLTGTFAEADYNPVGSYIREFDLEPGMAGKDLRLRFEGVEQAYYVWLNGTFIGYSEDSFTAHEFMITDVIKEKGNVLAVEVHKRSTAAFLEGQD
ncbi:MAG: beta-galactosidase, partial [Lachnospiraceae bacterium]|nr:beta-galactosidase [Lachnospiraceae bacterium]